MKSFSETFFACESDYDDAAIVIFGAPFDSTTSFRPGARFASREMRSESFGLETYSPYQDRDLSDSRVFDSGDLELPFGNAARALELIEARAAEILDDGKLPLMLGGEHLVTLGAFRAASARYPDLCVVHFDAHTDLREDYLGERLSHATVIRRCWETVGDGRIHQFGIRSGERAEFEWAKSHTDLHKFGFDGLAEILPLLRGKPVYFTIDLDVLDPSVFPGTGTPEAGGVTFMQLLGAMESVCGLNVVGCDLNELAPVYDRSGASTATACKVLRELLLFLSKQEEF
ncbi:MAG: agmatinase [Oscillospiraceae bacterium]|jgi:agmatinase|nr:agmatinase [Oscillospiraceae bacterium]